VTALDFLAMAPYLTLLSGILILVLVVSFFRNHLVVMIGSVVVLLATLVSIPFGLDAGPRLVSGFMVLDGYVAYFNVLFMVAAIVTVLLSRNYLEGRAGEPEEFYLLLLTSTLGAMVLAAAEHFAAVLLGLEIMSISLYVLISYSEEGHPPLEAALKYLVLSGVASTTMLFGMAMLYNATGTLVVGELLNVALSHPRFELHVLIGHGLLVAGLAFKLSLVPFHMWTPDVYHGAPAPVSGFLATASKTAVFAFLFRYVVQSGALEVPSVLQVMLLFAVLSMVVGNILALLQTNVKRILAYSSISHAGYLLVAVVALVQIADTNVALEAGMVYLAGYVLMTLASFGVVAVLSSSSEETDAQMLSAYQGLFWRKPLAATVLTVALLSLAGIPLTVGFIAKFYLIGTGIEGGIWLLVWALVIGSAIGIYYYLRIVLTMTKPVTDQGRELAGSYRYAEQTGEGLPTLVVLGVVLILFGTYPAPLIDAVRDVLRIAIG
jgi:NADH-quinone oxidoreductase subunit N